MKVLIVDDNADDRRLLRYNLERHGCESVIEARDGQEGIELANADRPDLIISDALMPRLDGFQFLRFIKTNEDLKAIPFVFYSATYTGLNDEAFAFSLGADAYFHKPTEPEELWKEIVITLGNLKEDKQQPAFPRLLEEENEYLKTYSSIVAAKLEAKVSALEQSLADRERAEEERLAHLRFFECMDRVNRAIQGTNDLDRMMSDVLDAVLMIFDGDRAFLMYPCDPQASTWRLPMVRSKPGYPALPGIEMAMDPDDAGAMRILLDSDGPVKFGPETGNPRPSGMAKRYGTQSLMSMAIYPKMGKPWQFGLDQCAYPRAWTQDEERLMQEIGRRVADALSSLLSHRDLLESEAKFRRIVDTANEGIWMRGADDRTTFVNARMAEMLGYSCEEMNARPSTDFMFKEDNPDHLQKTENRRHGLSESYERRFRRKDGETVWTLVSAVPVMDPGHRFTGSFAMLTDITERKRAEGSLALRSFMLDNVREAAYLMDQQGRLLYVNEEACRALGYDRDELLGMSMQDINSNFRVDGWHEHWVAVKTQGAQTSESLHGTKDGRIFPVELSCKHIEFNGTPYHLALARDISERRRIEEEQAKLQEHRQQAQKMEAIGQLSGGVAHDFNNLLSVINGFSEMLLQEKGLSDSNRSEVKEILAAGQRAAGLTRQLLAFSRKLVLEPQVLCLNNVIEGFQKMLRSLLEDELEIRMLLDPDLDLVKADPNQMEQVLLNLCINARDAMPEGGRITLETTNMDVDETMAAQHLSLAAGRYVKLAVSDTGTGMDPETLSHIFEPFFTTKALGQGTGLGLSTVYGIVKQSGGQVTVYSEPGHGSTFCVYLPVDQWLTPSREPEQRLGEIPRGLETILLVEDSAPLCAFFHKFLEGQGYTVLVAKDGELALQIASQHQGVIDLVLTDVSMPKLKGPAMTKILLQSRPDLCVLFMSGYAEKAVAERQASDGAAFLQKPFSTETLARKIRSILNGRTSA